MKLSVTLATTLVGLAAAAPQSDPVPEDLAAKVEEVLRQVEVKNTEANNGGIGGTINDVVKQIVPQAAGNLYPPIGQGASIVALLATSEYKFDEANGKEWLKNLGGLALSFLPKVATLGNLPGFIGIIKTIAIGIEAAQFPELTAKRAAAAKCFAANSEKTYNDVCANCKPELAMSLLARLNKCTNENVVSRNAYEDNKFAQSFCGTVLCSGHRAGDIDNIIKQGFRYDPVRAFWCKEKEEIIGMIMSPWIGQPLLENYHKLDHEDLRQALTEPCQQLFKTQGLQIDGVCPTRAEFDEANTRSVPQSFCAPGKKITPQS